MGPETLYIVRHAPAEDENPAAPGDDSQRRLTADGADLGARMAEALFVRGVRPDLIWTSPYVRTRDTALLMQERMQAPGGIRSILELAPGGDLGALVEGAMRAPAKRLMLVGHAPGVAMLVARLAGDGRTRLFFERAGAAELFVAGTPERPRCEIVWLTPAEFLLGV